MKLYFSKGACSLAVRIVMNELAVPCEFEAVNLKTHQTERAVDFYGINPKGAVPALTLDNGELLTENNVIQQYLADTYDKEGHLLAKSGIKRYQTLSWMNFVSSELHKGCSPLFNSTIPQEIKDQVFRPMLLKKLGFVDQHLAKNSYLMGDDFQLPDAYLFVVLRWLPILGVEREKFQHLEAFFHAVSKRPAIVKSLMQEQLK